MMKRPHLSLVLSFVVGCLASCQSLPQERSQPDPSATQSKRSYFLLGEVSAARVQPFVEDLTVFEAVMDHLAEGSKANWGKVQVIRCNAADPLILPVDIDAMLQTGDSTSNILVQENDVIFVPSSSVSQVPQSKLSFESSASETPSR